jgi:hypothetical protein
MKSLMLLGGLIGFCVGLGFSWSQGSPWPVSVWRASLAALAGGVLLQWWGRLWIKCLLEARHAARSAPAARVPEPATSTPANSNRK